MKARWWPVATASSLMVVSAAAIMVASSCVPVLASSSLTESLPRAQNAHRPSKSLFFGSGPIWSPNKEYAATYVDGDIVVYVKRSGQLIDYNANAVLANSNLAGNGEVTWAAPDQMVLDTVGGWLWVDPLTGKGERLRRFSPFTSRLYSIDRTGRFYVFGVGGQTTNAAPNVIPPLRIFLYDRASGTAALLLIVPKPRSGISVSISRRHAQPFVTVGQVGSVS